MMHGRMHATQPVAGTSENVHIGINRKIKKLRKEHGFQTYSN